MSEFHSTADYHRRGLSSLGWEFTICNALYPRESPCRSILARPAPFGHLLYEHLNRYADLSLMSRVLEVGGGYGYLMKDFLDLNPALQAIMIDISPLLIERQRRALDGKSAVFIEGDLMEIGSERLRGHDVVILNEVLGDLPTLLEADLETIRSSEGEDWESVRDLVFRYELPLPERGAFNFNFGALRAAEKILRAGPALVFLGEHSCESSVPAHLDRLIQIEAGGNPRRISLRGHDEYTVKFSHVEKLASHFGYGSHRGTYSDIVEIDKNFRIEPLFRARVFQGARQEILRNFISDLYQYEYLVLTKDEGG